MTKCIKFQNDHGNMNSESYSAFHTDCIYWLVACHLPTISVVLYIVSLGMYVNYSHYSKITIRIVNVNSNYKLSIVLLSANTYSIIF